MEKIRKVNCILSGGVKDDIIYKVSLATYETEEKGIARVEELVQQLSLDKNIIKRLKTYVKEVPRGHVDKELIGDLKVIITDRSKLNYDVIYNSNLLSENELALVYYENKKDKNYDLKISILKDIIDKLKVNLEFENKLLTL